jgi:hypothetical protein
MFRTASLVVLASFSASACSDLPTVQTPSQPQSRTEAASVPAYMSPEGEWARISQEEIPGFAGYFMAADGSVVVQATQVSSRTTAESYVRNVWARAKLSTPAIAFRHVRFDAHQLVSWRALLYPLYPDGIFVSTDIDEIQNRIEVGVPIGAPVAMVHSRLVTLGIPAEALAVIPREQNAADSHLTLRSRIRPVNAGVELQMSVGGRCT